MKPSSTMNAGSTLTPIVAIGAAAGGIVALQKVFQKLPASVPFAIVVLQHLPSGHSQRLAALISNWTPLPVLEAKDHVVPRIGAVYVPSPDCVLTVGPHALRTRRDKGDSHYRGNTHVIDRFLESLAQHHGKRSIAIILSGTGIDGTAGAFCIQQAGGIVIVQDPLTAVHDGMPNAVIRRDIHDHVLPPGAIGQQLVACSAAGYSRPQRDRSPTQEDTRALAQIILHIRMHSGLDLTGYKTSPLLWRVRQRMGVRSVRDFADYACLIAEDAVELESLIRELPIHVTEFFRDPAAWAALKADVLIPLMQANSTGNPVRTWTAGCASGEEAYSLAMTLEDIKQEMSLPASFQSFVTDASPEILHHASRGVFAAPALGAVSAKQRKDYFYSADKMFRVTRHLRDQMVFSSQNLISDPPFADMDLVTCRNLLIYLEPSTARQAICVLHSALRVGGYLFLGGSESYDLAKDGFRKISAKFNIFQKTARSPDVPPAEMAARQRRNIPTFNDGVRQQPEDQFVFPSVLVNEQGQLLRIYGDTRAVLRIPAGAPTHDFFALVPWQWVDQLRHAMRDAFALDEQRVVQGLSESSGLRIRMTPMRPSDDSPPNRLLLSFVSEENIPGVLGPVAVLTGQQGQPEEMKGTSSELGSKPAFLSHDELTVSRDQLQTLNEELLASNALLNTSNDDLHSANARLHGKIAQLETLSNILSSGEVMTIFLDKARRLCWFTPAMTLLFPLIPKDVGRDIKDLVPKFSDSSFFADITDVLNAGHHRDTVVHSIADKWYLRRMYPYPVEGGNIEGVAITFDDITERRHVENALWASEHMLRRGRIWLSSQKEAFEAAMNGAPLSQALGILLQTIINETDDDRRCAFYVEQDSALHHVVGMPKAYAQRVDGSELSLESVACRVATSSDQPVTTCDILLDKRWQPWAWLIAEFGYRACWAFPLRTSHGNFVGALAMYFKSPRTPQVADLELAAAMAHTAAILISKDRRIVVSHERPSPSTNE